MQSERTDNGGTELCFVQCQHLLVGAHSTPSSCVDCCVSVRTPSVQLGGGGDVCVCVCEREGGRQRERERERAHPLLPPNSSCGDSILSSKERTY